MMKINSQYFFDEDKGLYFNRNNKHTLIANACPYLMKRLEIQDNSSGMLRHILRVKIVFADNVKPAILLDIHEEELRPGKLQKILPLEIISEDVSERTMMEHFIKIIKVQVSSVSVETMVHYKFGWNDLHYYWGDSIPREVSMAQKHAAALKIIHILENSNEVISGVFFAAIHGPLKSVFIKAGIYHDFTTYIYGESAVGKTELCRNFCDYIPSQNNILSLASTRKEMKKFIENKNDCTIIIDDFCKTSSKGMYERQLQSLSELIQSSCNAGKMLVDNESPIDTSYSAVHLIVTGESLIKNLSSINRCYFIKMEQQIQQNIWKEIVQLSEDNIMLTFMQGLVQFIEGQSGIVLILKQDFDYLRENMETQVKKSNFSINNRIINTLAVQKVLKSLFIQYLNCLNVERKRINHVDDILNHHIDNCGLNMLSYLNELKKEEKHTKYLIDLYYLFFSALHRSGGKNYLADNAKDYVNWRTRGEVGRECLGILQKNNYISFSGNIICRQLAKSMKVDTVSKNILIKELSHFGLLKVDTDGRKSWKWNTPGRYYHVNFRELDRIVSHMLGSTLAYVMQKGLYDFRIFNRKKYLDKMKKF